MGVRTHLVAQLQLALPEGHRLEPGCHVRHHPHAACCLLLQPCQPDGDCQIQAAPWMTAARTGAAYCTKAQSMICLQHHPTCCACLPTCRACVFD